jgi:hypothetical protein
MRPITWAVSTGVPSAPVVASATRSAGAVPWAAARGGVPAAGLGTGAGAISGKRPEAFPAAMRVLFRFGTGPGAMTGKRPEAFPVAIIAVVMLSRLGRGPRGSLEPGPDEPAEEAPAGGSEPELTLVAGDAERAGLDERVELALGLGLDDADPVGLALGLGLDDADPVGLALGEGAGDAEPVAVALGAGVGADVDGEAEGDADVEGDADGLGELEAPGLVLVPAGAEDGEADGELDGWVWAATTRDAGAATLASAGPGRPAKTRKPPVTRPATTARPCATDVCIACLRWLCGFMPECDDTPHRIGSPRDRRADWMELSEVLAAGYPGARRQVKILRGRVMDTTPFGRSARTATDTVRAARLTCPDLFPGPSCTRQPGRPSGASPPPEALRQCPPLSRYAEVERSARSIAGAETRCGKPAAQAIPEALSGLYPGVRNRSWSWRRRMPILLPSMIG